MYMPGLSHLCSSCRLFRRLLCRIELGAVPLQLEDGTKVSLSHMLLKDGTREIS